MRVFLVMLGLAVVVTATRPSLRLARQVWAFPDEDNTPRPMPPARPQTLPPRQPPSPQNPVDPPQQRPVGTTPTAAAPGGSTTPPPGIVFQIPNCDCPSPPQYNPVCGTNGVTYVNRQKLNCAAQCGTNVQFERLGVCATPRK